jgi:regulator of extracellular matrix RemA (YlzA/DUF370 family)
MRFIDVGFGNSVNYERVIAIVSADTAPSRRMCGAAKAKNLLVDATCGKKTNTLLITDSGHIVQTHKNIAYFSKYDSKFSDGGFDTAEDTTEDTTEDTAD